MSTESIAKGRPSGATRARDLLYESTPRSSPTITPTGLREPFPIVLQRRAREVVRVHASRSLVRVAALLFTDAAILFAGRGLFHGIIDRAWLGETFASMTRALVPEGAYSVTQVGVALLLGLAAFGNYRAGDARKNIRTIFSGTALGLALVFWGGLWGPEPLVRLVGLTLLIAVVGVGLSLERLAVDRIVRSSRPVRLQAARTLVIGRAEDSQRLIGSDLLRDPAGFQVLGFVDVAAQPVREALGSLADLVWLLEKHKVDTMVLAGVLGERTFDGLVDIADAAGCQLLAIPPGASHRQVLVDLRWRNGTPMLQLTRPALRGPQLLVKRVMDVAIGTLVLILTAPLLALIAIAVFVTSPGPVLFRQLRVGKGGRRFHIIKFRTMVRDAEARREELVGQSIYSDPRLFKIQSDPRTTVLGRLLRRASLDELPQLWNVLRGEMSLVGPRPPLPSEVELYEEHHYTRFDMKPGITGPWQVSGRNRITDFEEIVRLESAYLRQWTIWKDVEILFRTVPAVLRMDGAH